MAKVHALGIFVLIFIVVEISYRTDAYEIVFSPDLTTDFAKGSIDVPGLIRQDWLQLPLLGFCGLASKFSTAHKFDTAGVRGTFYTTFEYLTQDCTAEHKRDNNTCALLTAAFAVCLGFPLDRRTCNHPWGYCSNFNFRLSYLWVPTSTLGPKSLISQAASDFRLADSSNPSTIVAPNSDSATTLAASDPSSRLGSSSDPSTRHGSSSHPTTTLASLADPPADSDPATTGPAETLAAVRQDFQSLSKLSKPFGNQASGGRLDTGCDWRYSNLVPVAWDGIQNVLVVGQSLQSPDSTYSLVMQQDCNLVLYKRGADGKYEFNAKWASYSHYSDPFFHNCSSVLQPNGNLVVQDAWGAPRWASNGTSASLYTSALAVLRNGSVAVYEMDSGTVLWSTG